MRVTNGVATLGVTTLDFDPNERDANLTVAVVSGAARRSTAVAMLVGERATQRARAVLSRSITARACVRPRSLASFSARRTQR